MWKPVANLVFHGVLIAVLAAALIKPLQRVAHVGLRDVAHRFRRAPCAHDNLRRAQQATQLVDHRALDFGRRDAPHRA
jgi:hypothetical protein